MNYIIIFSIDVCLQKHDYFKDNFTIDDLKNIDIFHNIMPDEKYLTRQ